MTEATDDQQDLLEFLYACPVGLVEFDATGAITLMNPHAMKHLLPLAGMRDTTNLFTVLDGCAPEIRNLSEAFLPARGMVCDGQRIVAEIGRGHAGSAPKTLACTIVKLAANRSIATFADITAQVTLERRVKEAETWFASLVDNVNDYAVLSITPSGVIESVNASFPRQTGHACEVVAGRPLEMVLTSDPASGSPSLAEQLHIAARDGWYLDENWMTRRNGERYWCQRLFAARTAADGVSLAGYSVVLRDVVHQGADTARLRRLLTQDHLTGAANRAHFLSMFEREHRRWRDDEWPLSLVMIDIDHFKAINDRHGHPVGDRVLRQLTETCSATLRPADLFARLGGEEFAVLLPDTTLEEATAIAEALRVTVAAMTIEGTDAPLSVTASFGCATAITKCETIETLVKLADDQLYAAKRGGRNRVCAAVAVAVAA